MSQNFYPVLRGDEDIDWRTGEIFKVPLESTRTAARAAKQAGTGQPINEQAETPQRG